MTATQENSGVNVWGRTRILQLDGLRALAILAVLIHHAFHVPLLWMGVDLFFVLSGFLITGILIAHRKKSFGQYMGRFYQRRAKRIYPPYFLLLVVTTVLFGVAWMRHAYMYIFLMNFILPLRIAQPGTIAVLWSLAVEEQFYLLWPFAVYFMSEMRLKWLAGGLIVLAPLLRWLCTPVLPNVWAIYTLLPFRMDCLATGALLAILWRTYRHIVERFGQYGLVLTLLAGITLGLLTRIPGFTTHANTRATNVAIYELTLVVSTGMMLWALSGRWVGCLKLVPLRYIGQISYSMYLIHSTALVVSARYVHSTSAIAITALAVTLGYSALSWKILEQPLIGRPLAEATATHA